jgi:hypothetical protein
MIAILLALMLHLSDATGDLIVRCPAGTEVFVDGDSFGNATTGGLPIRGLVVGPHSVELRSSLGGVANFNVTIYEAKEQYINVSALGFKLKPKSETPIASVRIQSDVAPCDVAIGDVTAEKTGHELNIGTLPVGRQKLAIVCGSKHAEAMLNLGADELQIIEPDFEHHTARILAHRRRVTQLKVNSDQEEIMSASIPAEWKRVLSGAGAKALSVIPISGTAVRIAYACTTREQANSIIDRLHNEIVQDVTYQGMRRDTDGLAAYFTVRFYPAGQVRVQ